MILVLGGPDGIRPGVGRELHHILPLTQRGRDGLGARCGSLGCFSAEQ